MIRRILALSLILTVCWTTTWAAAPALAQTSPPTKPSYDEAMERLDRFMALLEELRSQIDRSQFDTEALLDRLDYDAENVIRFVKEEISFEQYPGLLRGAQGTLMSRAGNSIDQAILTASLLKDSGYEARIVRSAISSTFAADLLRNLSLPKSDQEIFVDRESALDTLMQLAAEVGFVEADQRDFLATLLDGQDGRLAQLSSEAEESSKGLLSLLESEGLPLSPRKIGSDLVDEARDYFWVQYRQGQSDSWIQVHPAVGGGEPGPRDLEAQEIYSEQIPSELTHRLSIRVVIEQKTPKGLIEHEVMKPFEQPVANLIGVPLAYSNVPSSLTSDADQDSLIRAIEESPGFFPVFGSSLAPGAQAFDLAGTVIAPDVLASPAAGVFKQVQEKGLSASSALSSIGTSAREDEKVPLLALTCQWIEYTMISPGGEKEVFRRAFLDRLLPRNDGRQTARVDTTISEQSIRHALARQHVAMASVGRLPNSYVVDRTLQRILNSRPLFQIYLSKQMRPDLKVSVPENVLAEVETIWTGHLFLYNSFDADPGSSNQLNYRSHPALVVYQQPIAGCPSGVKKIDIIASKRRAFTREHGGWFYDPQSVLRAGVWETRVETTPLYDPEAKLTSAFDILRPASSGQAPINLLSRSESESLVSRNLPAGARSHLQSDLSKGFLAALPASMTGSEPTDFAWWRIEPTSGETLGMLGDGTGGVEGATYIKLVSLVSLFIFSVVGFGTCMSGDESGLLCCLGDAVVSGVAGGLAGALVGAWLGAWAALFLVDMAGGYTSMVAGVMGALPTLCD